MEGLLPKGELDLLKSKLNKKQMHFCLEYIIDFNGTRSAKEAGYGKKSAASKASDLLTNTKVQQYIGHLAAVRATKTGVTAERVVRELALIAFQDSADILEQLETGDLRLKSFEDMGEATKLIKKFKTKRLKEDGMHIGELEEVETYDKLKALELLGRHTKVFTDNVDITSGGDKLESKIVNVHIEHRAPNLDDEIK